MTFARVSICLLIAIAAGSMPAAASEVFGKTPAGEEVRIYTLKNSHGMEARIINYGGIVVSLKTRDRSGQLGDVVLGFDSLEGYLKVHPYFGAIVGRYGNRIANAKFSLNGKEYQLAANDGKNSLHGGLKGFDKQVWKVEEEPREGSQKLVMSYLSRDGEEGYPGNLTTRVTYTLTEQNELRIDYSLSTDKDTVANVTNHSYFNLSGGGDILGHEIEIRASKFTPVDAGLIPVGELRSVENTPLDFRQLKRIGERINSKSEQMRLGGGYDHNYVLDKGQTATPELAARVYDRKSGRVMEVLTTEPGVQFYTGNFLDGSIKGKGGKTYKKRSAFCLETQHFPDSPNQPDFPSSVLKAGSTYKSATVFRFSAK